MHRFSNILFINDPAENAEPALERAVGLAKRNSARLTLVQLVGDLPQAPQEQEILPEGLQKWLTEAQKAEVKGLADELDNEAIEVDAKILVGKPFLEVIREVIRGHHDLVIKPSESRSGISGMLFGSTDLHLLRKCPCPVWIVKPSQQKKHTRILAAVDPDPGEKANSELNCLILDLASSLAAQESSELHIVHAWSMPYESKLRSGRGYLPTLEIDKLVRATRNVHRQWMDETLAAYKLPRVSSHVHLIKGEPGEVIPDLAREKMVDLIVMGTVARTGVPGLLIGNTAEKTLAEVDCSVLAIKPEAFSTPVQLRPDR